jgi:hypothetical protein
MPVDWVQCAVDLLELLDAGRWTKEFQKSESPEHSISSFWHVHSRAREAGAGLDARRTRTGPAVCLLLHALP